MSNFDKDKVLEKISGGLDGLKVLVVGDIMLDRYIWGNVVRISPEAPVPVVHIRERSDRAGGAANVALNLAGLGVQVILAGMTGADEAREQLIENLRIQGVDTKLILSVPERPTITKTRIIGSHQQMIRLDEEVNHSYTATQEHYFLENIFEELHDDPVDVVILSDYAKGVLSQDICQSMIKWATGKKVSILVDPKGLNFQKYKGCTLITPNIKEISGVLQTDSNDLEILLQKAKLLRDQLEINNLLITRGDHGISLLSEGEDQFRHFPAQALEVFDVSGAGDTVIATLAGFISSGLSMDEIIVLANIAAGVVVSKVGTVPINRAELIQALREDSIHESVSKIYNENVLLQRIYEWKKRGEKVVFTNGCFDILHVGHVTYLEAARKLGDRLVIGLNTDRSVRLLKGEGRPVIQQEDRARVLAALTATDAIVFFDDETPLNLIKLLKPDVLVKGSDYTEDEIVGAKEIRSWGGTVELVQLVEGRSTTSILNRVQKNNKL